MSAPLQAALRLGLSYLPLAKLSLAALERSSHPLPPPVPASSSKSFLIRASTGSFFLDAFGLPSFLACPLLSLYLKVRGNQNGNDDSNGS